MPIIKVAGVEMDVDIRGELEEYTWVRPTWTETKLIAASPFRYDQTPSFFVNLDGEYAGTWKDSGAYDADYESGGFAKLLAFLRDETYEETVDYLFDMYAPREQVGERLKVPEVALKPPKQRITLNESLLTELAYRSPYLGRRGIGERVQRFMDVGYSQKAQAISMPWRHPDGVLANIKYRKVRGKAFWYERNAAPIRSLVYGIDKVYRHNLTDVVVCEAEIDAMTWMESGKPAIAIGGTSVSNIQLDLIRKSPIERIIIAEDNDKAGGKLGRQLARGLVGHVEVAQVKLPSEYKDANEAHVAGIDIGRLPTKKVFDKFRVKAHI